MTKTITIDEAKNRNRLGDDLKELKLLGSYNGKLFFGCENGDGAFTTLIFDYSLRDKEVGEPVRIRDGSWPESWAQKGKMLFVGTRFGYVSAIDMETCRERASTRMDNSIDAIAVNGNVYFGVNGKGIYKSDDGFEKKAWKNKKNVVSAITPFDDKLAVFYFSNGNDPYLDGSQSGGIVEILDQNLEVLRSKGDIPYAVTQAVTCGGKIFFTTRETGNGNVPNGDGGLYELNPRSLKHHQIRDFSAAVNILRMGNDGTLFIGLKDGRLIERYERKEKVLRVQEYPITGVAFAGKYVYASSSDGEVARIKR